MKVLLLQDLKGLGKRYDIKEVKEGYARNFLFPRKLAMCADEKATRMKKAAEIKEAGELAHLRAKAEQLKGERLVFKVRVGERGEVFGGIHAAQIEKALGNRGYEGIGVKLPHPLKSLGAHEVEVHWSHGVSAAVKVVLETELDQ